MSYSIEVALSATERLSTLMAVLGVGQEEMQFVEKDPTELMERFHIPCHAGEFIPTPCQLMVSCLEEYIGVHDSRNLPDVLPKCESETVLNFGHCPDELRELNSLLKEKLAIYTIHYGFCHDNPNFKVQGYCFFINYMLYVDGKSIVVTTYQAAPGNA